MRRNLKGVGLLGLLGLLTVLLLLLALFYQNAAANLGFGSLAGLSVLLAEDLSQVYLRSLVLQFQVG